ncbi:MAG: DUF4097 family beta strand repeat-containing protein [Clostridia bacterium]|nr:DUF4097 family beta strand repeat-containing protein [Clostridia bacterium]
MNERVSSIVDALFHDVIRTDEVKAMHDELMDNCQTRYADLLREGVSEEDAIAAVLESLKGMEEVIGKYPKKENKTTEEAQETQEAQEETYHDRAFDTQEIDTIKVIMSAADVILAPSADEKVHVIWDGEMDPLIDLMGGTLNISQQEKQNRRKQSDEDFVFSGKNIWNMIRQSLSGHIHYVEQVTVTVPEHIQPKVTVLTSAGDLKAHDVRLTSFRYNSSSGDLDADRLSCDETATINTASGDVKARHLLVKESMKVDAVSGDVRIDGTCPELALTIVSGDGDVDGHFRRVQTKCINGDMTMSFGTEIQQITAKNTNGDITVYLPKEIEKINLGQQSSLRNINCNGFCFSDEGPVVELKALTGDINIRRING